MKERRRPRYPHIHAIKHLPLKERVKHPSVRGHLKAGLVGLAVMLTATGLSIWVDSQNVPPRVIWDCFLAFAHGVGMVPLAAHFDPLWALLSGE